ncbi:MAG: diacylglycerol kinase family protein [Oscillospiraceae bacterium]|nr:diacylglycerol kinase family protein [Oscillospiraceae bacterium]
MPYFIFIVNPVAGKGLHAKRLCSDIKDYFSCRALDYEIHCTGGIGDALAFVRDYPSKEGRRLCFVACGGDGTLHEVVNGAVCRHDCSVSAIPCGSGNDYVKNFGTAGDFTDLDRLVRGAPHPVDLLDCSGEYAVNLCNIGFDARVANHMSKFKQLPFVSGPLAYRLSVLFCILGPISSAMTISGPDGETLAEKLILAVIANGFCYGGGYYPAPDACTVDGVMEFCGVRKMSRLQISRFIRIYQKGQHLKNAQLAPKILYRKGQSITIRSKHPLVICLDGEIRKSKELSIRLAPAALHFWLPEGAVPANLPAMAVAQE